MTTGSKYASLSEIRRVRVLQLDGYYELFAQCARIYYTQGCSWLAVLFNSRAANTYSHFFSNFLQSVVPTWRTGKILKWQHHCPVITHGNISLTSIQFLFKLWGRGNKTTKWLDLYLAFCFISITNEPMESDMWNMVCRSYTCLRIVLNVVPTWTIKIWRRCQSFTLCAPNVKFPQ
jgi:hypothetical protein